MALADVAETRPVDPLDRGDIRPAGVHGAPGAGHQVQQDQITRHDQPVAAYRLDHGGPCSVRRPGRQPELDVTAEQLGHRTGRNVDPGDTRASSPESSV